MTENLERLATAVKSARTWRGLSQLEVHALGGPSNSTLTQIEAGRPPAPSLQTMKKLEKAFDWPAGMVRLILSDATDEEVDARLDEHRGLDLALPPLPGSGASEKSSGRVDLSRFTNIELIDELARRARRGDYELAAHNEDIEAGQGHDETP